MYLHFFVRHKTGGTVKVVAIRQKGPLLRGRCRTILQIVTAPLAASLAQGRALMPASISSPGTQELAAGIL